NGVVQRMEIDHCLNGFVSAPAHHLLQQLAGHFPAASAKHEPADLVEDIFGIEHQSVEVEHDRSDRDISDFGIRISDLLSHFQIAMKTLFSIFNSSILPLPGPPVASAGGNSNPIAPSDEPPTSCARPCAAWPESALSSRRFP